MNTKLPCLDNPCVTCPYRKDAPPGIWDKSEYDKLPAWDGREFHQMNTAIFMCHSANLAGNKAVCRGWMEVHSDNIGVRMSMSRIEHNGIPTKVPLYSSGDEARRAGLRGVKQPSRKAKDAATKLFRARAAKAERGVSA